MRIRAALELAAPGFCLLTSFRASFDQLVIRILYSGLSDEIYFSQPGKFHGYYLFL